jgi:hypothetical protein
MRVAILFFVSKEKNQKKNFLRETAVSLMASPQQDSAFCTDSW